MAHRHERYRHVVQMPFEKLVAPPHGCAWNGCTASFAGQIPDGWRWLLLHGGDPVLRFDDIPLQSMDQDAVLCPMHVGKLNGLLKHFGDFAND
jgi:hypothetical protein